MTIEDINNLCKECKMRITGCIMDDKVEIEIEFTIHLNKSLDEKISIDLDETNAYPFVDIIESYGSYKV